VSGHKLYAPKGVGALYVRKGTKLAPIAFGGHHERDRRPGTENVPGIAAFGVAAEVAGRNLASERQPAAVLRDRLENAVPAASPASPSTARAGSARPTPPTCVSTASMARPW
jgi:cysteine desulfurase